jgi:hypothetical protein
MSGRWRILIMAGGVIATGGALLVHPASADAAQSPKLCSLKCPAIPGKTFCGGFCTDDGAAECDYVTTGQNDCSIYET